MFSHPVEQPPRKKARVRKNQHGAAAEQRRPEHFCPACHKISYAEDGAVGGHKRHTRTDSAYCPEVDRVPNDREKREWQAMRKKLQRKEGGFDAYVAKLRREQGLVCT